MRAPALWLHGPGRAGTSLVTWLERRGARLVGASGGGEEGREALAEALGREVPWTPRFRWDPAADLVLLGVPDRALPEVAEELSAAPGVRAEDLLVVHLSGARGREVLAPLAAAGIATAAWHPLHPFPSRRPHDSGLSGALVAIEAPDAAARGRLHVLAEELGGRPVDLGAEGRALYHTAAAATGNGVLALLDFGVRQMIRAGLDEEAARVGLAHLAGRALQAAVHRGTAEALTGPVVRGDRPTIARHLEALERAAPEDLAFYRELAIRLAGLAARRADGREASRLRAWLLDETP